MMSTRLVAMKTSNSWVPREGEGVAINSNKVLNQKLESLLKCAYYIYATKILKFCFADIFAKVTTGSSAKLVISLT